MFVVCCTYFLEFDILICCLVKPPLEYAEPECLNEIRPENNSKIWRGNDVKTAR